MFKQPTDFRGELSEMEKFKRYLAENGLEIAGLADWIPDPKNPGRQILGVPVRPVVRVAPEQEKPGEGETV